MNFKYLFEEILKKVSHKNETDEQVKTADPVVFEEVKKKIELTNKTIPSTGRRSDMYKDFQEKIRQAQEENKADPVVETADASVYDDLMREIEKLKTQSDDINAGPATGHEPQAQQVDLIGVQAMTNTMGGSMQLRTGPSMTAAYGQVKVQDQILLKVIEYSDNKIILDGKASRFVLVETNGQRGWILESYLNFN